MSRQPVLFILWTLQGLIALAWLALLPGSTEGSLLFALSGARLALIGMALVLAGFSAGLAWRTRRTEFAPSPAQRDSLYISSLIVALSAPTTIIVLRALGQTSSFTYSAYADRLAPLAFWLATSALELALWLTWQQRKEIVTSLTPAKNFLRITLYILLSLTILTAFIAIIRPSLPAKDGSYGGPTTPLLEWQILLALIIGLVFITLHLHSSWPKYERWMPLLVYFFTCLLWLSQPINPGFFATPPRAPNFEIYPFSDALIYAQYAQSALAGHGFLWPDVPTRPLYVALLTWLHAIAGQDYTHIIILQTLLLAAFPAVLYLLGKELGGPPLGIGLALLAALRDLTANIAAPFALNYTYSKLFFSEIPAALLISLFTLLAIRWLRPLPIPLRITNYAIRNTHYALLIGSTLGLAALIRLQSAVLLFGVVLVGLVAIPNRKQWALGTVLMALGLGLTFAPWLARNLLATGGLVLDNPTSQTMTLARRWSGDNGNDLIPKRPGESVAQYSGRMMSLALDNLRQQPGRILGAAAGHLINNETGNLLIFPQRDHLDSPAELLWPQHAFWQDSQPDALRLAFYLLLLAFGLAVAWGKNGPLGLLPLGLSLLYNAVTALFLSSGDRFLVPVDWAAYLYLFLGLLTLVSLALSPVTRMRENVAAWLSARYNGETAQGEPGPVSSQGVRGFFLPVALILLIGASIPLTELAFPKITPLKTAATPPTETALYGRAVYPRWYAAGDGEPGSAKRGYGKSDEARLVFFLVGEQSTLVIFPLKTPPAFFPNASDVTVIGAQKDGFAQADKIIVTKNGQSAEYISP